MQFQFQRLMLIPALLLAVCVSGCDLLLVKRIGPPPPNPQDGHKSQPVSPVDHKPKPNPPPIHDPGFWVLIVEENDDRASLPPAQLSILMTTKIRGWVRDQNGEFREYDKDTDLSGDERGWQQGMDEWRKRLGKTPAIVISNGTTGIVDNLPDSIDATLKLLEQYKPK